MSLSVSAGTFFFQAEDGIRDLTVTGVQTCALPISDAQRIDFGPLPVDAPVRGCAGQAGPDARRPEPAVEAHRSLERHMRPAKREGREKRSEERRVGKEGRARGLVHY